MKVPPDSRWRPIPGFPHYWVSQHGHVFNMTRKALVSLHYNQHGVLSVRMYTKLTYAGARGYNRSVPKLVQQVWGIDLRNPEG